jgi:tetratricopeptide (TPR) repeat protein
MLEMIHEFALDALVQLPSHELERTRQRHAEYFAHILEEESDESWRIIDAEQHNTRAALRWLSDHKHPLTLDLHRFMYGYFLRAGLLSETRRWNREMLTSGIELTPEIHYRLLSEATIWANMQHDFEAALRYTDEALAIARAMNAQTLIADGLLDHGMVYTGMDDYEQAKAVAHEALRIGREIHEAKHVVGALNQLGEAALAEGDISQAEAFYTEAYVQCQAPDWQQYVYATNACKGMGEVALNRYDYEAALRYLREGLEHSRVPVLQVWVLDSLAGVIGTMPHRTMADVQRAAKIWGATEALKEKIGQANMPGDRRRTDALIAEARTHIAPETFATAWAEGRALSLDEAIELAMM